MIAPSNPRSSDGWWQRLARRRNRPVPPPESHHFTTEDAVRAAVSKLRRFARENVSIELSVAPTLPLLAGRSYDFEQLILHLAMQAIEAIPAGGTVWLAIYPVPARHAVWDSSGSVSVSVASRPGRTDRNDRLVDQLTLLDAGETASEPCVSSLLEAIERSGSEFSVRHHADGGAHLCVCWPAATR